MADIWPLVPSVLAFVLAAAVIGVVGSRLSGYADILADRTGLGEAFVGAVLLGAATSLSGIVATVTAAVEGRPSLAVSTAIGGIAAQTAFLAIADMAYRKVNLEHASASLANLMSGTLLVVLLALMLTAAAGPEVSVLGVHPVTPLMFVVYLFGMYLVQQARAAPMWWPRRTPLTREDKPDARALAMPLPRLLASFVAAAAVVAAAGWVVAQSGVSLAEHTGLSESAIGGLLVAIATSLPELVTSVAAVRRGAVTLAVGGIIGGNAFDTLFTCMADIAYQGGSIYHAASPREHALIALTVVMTAVLLLGLLYRQQRGPANIGFESVTILICYGVGAYLLNLPLAGS